MPKRLTLALAGAAVMLLAAGAMVLAGDNRLLSGAAADAPGRQGRVTPPRTAQIAPIRVAQAISVTGADILWYGIYTADTTKREEDAAAPGGTRRTSENVKPPKANSDRIALADGIRFGFGYRLIGQPKGTIVKVKTVQKYPAPGVFNKVKGTRLLSGEIERERAIGGDDQFMGFVVGKAAGLPVGNWTFELWYGDRKLAEKTFVVSRR